MVDINMQQPGSILGGGSKKRSAEEYMKPQQVLSRFKAKADFVHYFAECRKYMPPCNLTLVV